MSNATLPLNLKCNWLSQFLLQMTRSGVLEVGAGTSNVLAGRSRYLNGTFFFDPCRRIEGIRYSTVKIPYSYQSADEIRCSTFRAKRTVGSD